MAATATEQPKIIKHDKKYPIPSFWLETRFGNLLLTLTGRDSLTIRNNSIPQVPFEIRGTAIGVEIRYIRLDGDEWGVDPAMKNPANAVRFYDRAAVTKRITPKLADKALDEINDCLGAWLSVNEDHLESAEAVRLYNQVFEQQHQITQINARRKELIDSVVASQATLRDLIENGATLEMVDDTSDEADAAAQEDRDTEVPATVVAEPPTPAPKKGSKLDVARRTQEALNAKAGKGASVPQEPPAPPPPAGKPGKPGKPGTGPLTNQEAIESRLAGEKAREEAAARGQAKLDKAAVKDNKNGAKAPVVARPPVVPPAQPPAELDDEEEVDEEEVDDEEVDEEEVDEVDEEETDDEEEEADDETDEEEFDTEDEDLDAELGI
jgi:hypothetical protein